MKAVRRAEGQTTCAVSAYQSGQKIKDLRISKTFNYGNTERIHETGIETPIGEIERSTLWNEVENSARRKDAVPARKIQMAVPYELPEEERKNLVRGFSKEISEKFGVGVDWAYHTSSGRYGNPHAHLLVSSSRIEKSDKNGIGFAVGKKVYELDPIFAKKPSNNCQNPAEVIRSTWADTVNKTLERNKINAIVDHRSYERQGTAQIPGVHVGYGKGSSRRRIKNEAIKRINEMSKKLEIVYSPEHTELLDHGRKINKNIEKAHTLLGDHNVRTTGTKTGEARRTLRGYRSQGEQKRRNDPKIASIQRSSGNTPYPIQELAKYLSDRDGKELNGTEGDSRGHGSSVQSKHQNRGEHRENEDRSHVGNDGKEGIERAEISRELDDGLGY